MANTDKNSEHHTQVLLEELNSQFKAFGDGLDTVSRQLEDVQADTKDVKQRIERIEDFLKVEIPAMRREIGGLRELLSKKADLARLEALEARMDRLEGAVQSQS